MSGTLYVVATPIGNLEDITLRALRVLREATVVAAEDTRHTAKLLQHYAIATPTVSFHEHNTRSRIPALVERLTRGESIALVSDAGTPLLSDPGLELVQSCHKAHIRVEPIPGASATLAALVASGFPAHPVTFLGFAPPKANARIAWLREVSDVNHTVVFFESPHRIEAALNDMASVLGNRLVMIGREITKAHEEFLFGRANMLVNRQIRPQGEFTIVVAPIEAVPDSEPEMVEPTALAEEFRQLTESQQHSRRAAITALAQKYGRPAREIYATLEQAKKPHS